MEIDQELSTWVLTSEFRDIEDHIVQNDKLVSVGNPLIKLYPRYYLVTSLEKILISL
jgi:hypothetical protein